METRLRIPRPDGTTEERTVELDLVAQFASVNVKLPLCLCDEDIGVVLDDDGVEVFNVDPKWERLPLDVGLIALGIVMAVNTYAGFPVEGRIDG